MHIGRAFGLIFLAVIVNGSVDHAQRTNRYRNTHDERDRQTDRQTDTIEGRKAAFQGVQSVTRGEIANGVMVAEEQVKNRGKSESCGIHYATRPKPPSVFHFSASLVNNYSPKWR